MIRGLWGEDLWRRSSAVREMHAFFAAQAGFGTEIKTSRTRCPVAVRGFDLLFDFQRSTF